MLRPWLAAACALLAAACGSRNPDPGAAGARPPPGARGAPIEIPTSRELEEIARLQDARSLGNGHLLELLERGPRRARARGGGHRPRPTPYPLFGGEVTAALVRALEDPELDVRLAAASALSVRADPDSAGTLLAYRNDPEPRLRARLVEAASKLPDPAVHAQLVLSLRDADLSVRMETAVGAARWSTDEAGAGEVDSGAARRPAPVPHHARGGAQVRGRGRARVAHPVDARTAQGRARTRAVPRVRRLRHRA